MLTLEQLKKVNIPINVYNKPNNLRDASRGVQLYNDSVNLYDALELWTIGSAPATNLTHTLNASSIDLFSSTGTDTTLPSATTSLAGVMSATDKTNLNALITLSGVSAGALNLGTFSGSIIADNLTIKAALQSLESAVGSIPILNTGHLTAGGASLTITNGSNAVIGSGTIVSLNPSAILLSTLGGSLNLTQLSTSGATTGQFLTYNGTNWVPATYTQTVPNHNDLGAKQGGTSGQFYHLNQSVYDKLNSATATTVLGRGTGTGEIESVSVAKSLVLIAGELRLNNDLTAPGNNMYYGTDGSGVRGWLDTATLPGGVSSVNVTDSLNIDFTVTDPTTTPVITADLIDTGVTASSYGSTTSVGAFTVDAKGRLTAASSVTISIPSSSVTDFSEAVDDRVNNLLVAGSNITLNYNDVANTLTISSATSSIDGSGTADQVAYWLDSNTLTSHTDFEFDGTYLTVGSPVGVSLARLTTRGLGATLSTYGYVHENSSNVEVFKVADNGAITIGALGDVYIHPDQMNISAGGEYVISKSGGDLTLYSDTQVKIESGGTATNTPSLKVVATRSTSIGSVYNAQIEGTFNSASGTNSYTDLHVKTVVNQTNGTAKMRSVYIEPTLTAAIDYTGLEINAPGHMALKTTAGNVSFNFGSDATGDIYYRNASGNLVRLPIGGPTEVLGSTGTVPAWTTTAGSLPGGSDGDILMYIGGWVSATRQVEKLTGITGTAASVGATPLALAPFDLFRNGVRQDDTDDYSISGTSITMVVALASTDKLTAIYYI